jgi:hypothetical protein
MINVFGISEDLNSIVHMKLKKDMIDMLDCKDKERRSRFKVFI